jgi:hypothetical protein
LSETTLSAGGNYRTHANEHIVVYRTAMHYGAMSDGHVISQPCRTVRIGTVDNGPVLDIHPAAYSYVMDIAPDDRVIPDRAVVAHNNVSDHYRVFRQKTIFPKSWRNTFSFFDNIHICRFMATKIQTGSPA